MMIRIQLKKLYTITQLNNEIDILNTDDHHIGTPTNTLSAVIKTLEMILKSKMTPSHHKNYQIEIVKGQQNHYYSLFLPIL